MQKYVTVEIEAPPCAPGAKESAIIDAEKVQATIAGLLSSLVLPDQFANAGWRVVVKAYHDSRLTKQMTDAEINLAAATDSGQDPPPPQFPPNN